MSEDDAMAAFGGLVIAIFMIAIFGLGFLMWRLA